MRPDTAHHSVSPQAGVRQPVGGTTILHKTYPIEVEVLIELSVGMKPSHVTQ
jgi:hypothetical protein